ncbi:MAG: patatin-like phospholipase family protein [Myxococcota bacterium]
MTSRRVFILGGGASLGAHQVGAMKYLEEQGIVPDAIVGSSIGVVNGCLYASGGAANMEEAWLSFPRMSSVFRPSLAHNPVTGISLFSMDPLSEAIERFVDFERVHSSPLELSFIVLNLSRGEGQFFSNRQLSTPDDLRRLTRAGYALPVLFPPIRHHDDLYMDGGFAWNVPLLQAVEMGATEIYVLSVVSTALPYVKRFRGMTDYLSRLVDVLWRTIGNVGYVTTRIDDDGTYRGVPVTVVNPTEELSGFQLRNLLSTSVPRTRRLVTMGYRDAKRELVRLERTRVRRSEELLSLEVEPAYRHEVA